MQLLPEGAEKCPHCGFSERYYKAEFYQLPIGHTLQNNRYQLGRVIGQGGFGLVYIGWDTKFKQVVAVKEFYSRQLVSRDNTIRVKLFNDTEDGRAKYHKEIERVEAEALAIKQFTECPGIVRVEDYFEENNTIYLVMAYIEGITMRQYLDNNAGGMDGRGCLELFRPLVRSLSMVHKKNMLHRDISLDNIILEKASGQLKLLDFGAARPMDFKTSTVTVRFGYAPMELYTTDKGSQKPAIDVYELCTCMWNCITGQKLPDANERKKEDDVWKGVNAHGLNGKQKEAIKKGLELEQQNRIQSMNELYYGLYGEWLEKPAPGRDSKAVQDSGEDPKMDSDSVQAQDAAPVSGQSQNTGGIPVQAQDAAPVSGGGQNTGGVPIQTPQAGSSGKGIIERIKAKKGIAAACGILVVAVIAIAIYRIRSGNTDKEPAMVASSEAGSVPVTTEEPSTEVKKPEKITFADATLEEAIRLKIGKQSGDIMPEDLEQITELYIDGNTLYEIKFTEDREVLEDSEFSELSKVLEDSETSEVSEVGEESIASLEGIQNCRNLKLLYIMENNISDLSPLQELTGLRILALTENQIEDISALENLTGLEALGLDENQIEDISALENLTGLKMLTLPGNQIQNISALGKMTEMMMLVLTENQIEDISALGKMTELSYLDLNHNEVRDISALEKVTGLKTLRLRFDRVSSIGSDGIEDISVLEKMTGLEELDLENNAIWNISALRNLTGLKTLILEENEIQDISALENLRKLETLNLKSNDIWDISALGNLIGLETLDLSLNDIQDISALGNLRRLQDLGLSYNKTVIQDISPLQNLENLRNLYLSEDQGYLQDSLGDMPNLTVHVGE